ncbi:metal-dependent transcriptional regulator [Methanoplanus sp. FWC-SCC4]|uniref:Metal-dependent transcriptional regulator n=1 Tax=Methanochimaera problematica TaxID=2609417 RepID=A0AA97I568_9EURY|nr:metal-dependent transcriptional regulator [Methanoplanus sp. FWC-SCC4]WOF17159.1 metal-dependent transcriptional regulator [Methanoplanus sp. FWC-SCC4]
MQQSEYEDYLEAIINNSFDSLSVESVRNLAAALNKGEEEITDDLHSLEEMGFLTIKADGSLNLTPEGIKTGNCIIKKHRVLECFLTEMLGVEPETASKEACELEHSASEDTIKRLKNYLNRPGPCRHRFHGGFEERDSCDMHPLTDFAEEDIVKVLCTMGGYRRTNRLNDLGVIPDEKIKITRKLANGSMVVIIKGCEVALSPEIAKSVFVSKEK